MTHDRIYAMGKRGMGTIYRRGRIWWIGYWRNGESFYESSKSESKDAAVRLLKTRQGEIVTGKFAGLTPGRVTVAEVLDLVVTDYRDNDRRSLSDLKMRIETQVRPYFGKLRAVDLTTGHALKFIQKRKSDEVTNATINRELAVLRRALNLAAQHDPPLVSRVIHIPRLKEHSVRTGFIEEEQYRRLLGELPERLKLLLVIAYHTGARKGRSSAFAWSRSS